MFPSKRLSRFEGGVAPKQPFSKIGARGAFTEHLKPGHGNTGFMGKELACLGEIIG